MILTIAERIELLSILPEKGNVLTLRIIAEVQNALSFSAEEYEQVGFKHGTAGKVHWDTAKDPNKDFTLSATAIELITQSLRKREEREELTLPQLSLYDKFVR